MEQMKAQLDEEIVNNERLREFKDQLRVEITPDGLRIQIVDNQRRPMFDLGSERLKPYMRDVLREFGQILNKANGRIVVTGHTDAIRYATGDAAYSNWELSLDRANASRRELIAGGMESNRFARVVGLADLNPLDRNNAANPLDRRISIIVLNRLADEQMQKAGGEIEAGSAKDLTGFATSAAADPLAGANAALDALSTATEPAP
jgi:chemotaxis protein MotB